MNVFLLLLFIVLRTLIGLFWFVVEVVWFLFCVMIGIISLPYYLGVIIRAVAKPSK